MNNVKNKVKVAICKNCHTYITYLNLYMDEWDWYHISVGHTDCDNAYKKVETIAEPEDIPEKIKPTKPRGR